MKEITINVNGLDIDYRTANQIAQSVAAMLEREPMVIAWHDKPHARMAPQIEGAATSTPAGTTTGARRLVVTRCSNDGSREMSNRGCRRSYE